MRIFTALWLVGAMFFPLSPMLAQDMVLESMNATSPESVLRDMRAEFVDGDNDMCVATAVSTEYLYEVDWDNATNGQGVQTGKMVQDTFATRAECEDGCTAIFIREVVKAGGKQAFLRIRYLENRYLKESGKHERCPYDL